MNSSIRLEQSQIQELEATHTQLAAQLALIALTVGSDSSAHQQHLAPALHTAIQLVGKAQSAITIPTPEITKGR